MNIEPDIQAPTPMFARTPTIAWVLSLGTVALGLFLIFGIELGFIFATPQDQRWATSIARAEHSQLLIDDSTVVTLERKECYGSCPAYVVALYGSGRIEYIGHNHVCSLGRESAATKRLEVARLVQAMIDTGFIGLQWEEDLSITDHATAVITLRHEGREHRVEHYLGDLRAPRWLSKMEAEIDRVANSGRWLPSLVDGIPHCAQADGRLRSLE